MGPIFCQEYTYFSLNKVILEGEVLERGGNYPQGS